MPDSTRSGGLPDAPRTPMRTIIAGDASAPNTYVIGFTDRALADEQPAVARHAGERRRRPAAVPRRRGHDRVDPEVDHDRGERERCRVPLTPSSLVMRTAHVSGPSPTRGDPRVAPGARSRRASRCRGPRRVTFNAPAAAPMRRTRPRAGGPQASAAAMPPVGGSPEPRDSARLERRCLDDPGVVAVHHDRTFLGRRVTTVVSAPRSASRRAHARVSPKSSDSRGPSSRQVVVRRLQHRETALQCVAQRVAGQVGRRSERG